MPYFDIEVYARMMIEGLNETDALNQARKDSPGWHARSTGSESPKVAELEAKNKELRTALIEERARAIYPFNMPTWEHLPEDDRVDKQYPTITQHGKAFWRDQAREQLAGIL